MAAPTGDLASPDALRARTRRKGRHGRRPGLSWLARRLGLAVLTLWLVSVLVFVATTALGDPVRAILGKDYNSDKARVAELDRAAQPRRVAGHPLLRTGSATCSPATSAPRSPTGSRSAGLIGDHVVNTLVLVIISAIVMIPVAFGIAMISTNYRRSRPDTIIQTVLLTLAALPEFVIGILLVALFSTTVFHLLPAVTLAGAGAPPVERAEDDDPAGGHAGARGDAVRLPHRALHLLEVLDSDYVELARLKGMPEKVVMRKHALLNAIVPGIQVIALQLAWLAGGVVFVE